MSPGATKLLALGRGCCVWPRGSLDDPNMTWCGEPVEHAGASYCERHRRRSICCTETDAPDDDIVEDVDSGRSYRIERTAGRGLGDRRVWRVVPIAPGGTARPRLLSRLPRRLSLRHRTKTRISERRMALSSRSGRARRHDRDRAARIWNRQQPGRLGRPAGPSWACNQYGSAKPAMSLVTGIFKIVGDCEETEKCKVRQ